MNFCQAKTINSSFPWEWVQMDLTGPKKTTSNGNEYILVLVDVLTSFCFLRALPSKEAKVVGEALVKIFADQGYPKILQSDNGSEFDNDTISKMVTDAMIEHRFSSAYKPSTNGQVERTVGSVSQLVNKLCMQFASNEWDKLLMSVQVALNTRVNEKTGQSPHFSFYWRGNGNQGIFGYDNSFAKPDLLDGWFQSENS
jgi:transposase InsO family protein